MHSQPKRPIYLKIPPQTYCSTPTAIGAVFPRRCPGERQQHCLLCSSAGDQTTLEWLKNKPSPPPPGLCKRHARSGPSTPGPAGATPSGPHVGKRGKGGGGEEGGGRSVEKDRYPSFFFFPPAMAIWVQEITGVKNVGSNPLCLGVRPLRLHHFIRKWLISALERRR